MASKDVTVKQWTCDACGLEVLGTSTGKAKPSGWRELTITLKSGIADMSHGIDVCQACAKNPEEAKRKARARWGQ
jgi:hypothetical protein